MPCVVVTAGGEPPRQAQLHDCDDHDEFVQLAASLSAESRHRISLGVQFPSSSGPRLRYLGISPVSLNFGWTAGLFENWPLGQLP